MNAYATTSILLGLAVFAGHVTLHAATHSLTNSDPMGLSSFNTGLNWNDGRAPAGGEDYSTTNFSLRTPASGASHTFAGQTLTIAPGGEINLKGANNVSLTISNLIYRGSMGHGEGNATINIRGAINIPSGATATFNLGGTENDRRELSIYAPISGEGAWRMDIYRNTSLMRSVSLLADNTAFTGPIELRQTGKLIVNDETGLGGNPPDFNPRQLSLDGTVLRIQNSATLDDPNRGIWLNTNGGRFEIGVDRTVTVACLIGGTGPLTKIDYGTLILTATNTYTGATSVQGGGTLCINSETNATASLTVSSGSSLGGIGTVHCAVTLAPRANIRLTGNGYGTLTLAHPSGLTLENADLAFDLRDALEGPSDCLALDGPLTLSGANTVIISLPPAGLPAGTYTLATYPSLGGDGTLALPFTYPNAELVIGPTDITLEVTGNGTMPSLTWTGSVDRYWDTATPNWSPTGALFGDGMDVVFDDTGNAANPVTLTAPAAPRNVTITTATKAYTITTGANTLTATTIGKYSTSALTLNGSFATDSFSVGTVSPDVSGGAVTLNGNLAITSGYVTVRPASGTFNQNAASVISGPGGVTWGSEANLRGTNTYTGQTTIGYNGFTKLITVYNPLALGAPGGAIILRGGTGGDYNRLVLAPGVTVTNRLLTVAQCDNATRRAGLWMRDAGAACWAGDIAIASDGYLQIGSDNGSGTLTVGVLGVTIITNASIQQLSFRGGGTAVLNSRLAMPTVPLNRDDAGTLIIQSSGNRPSKINISQGILRLNSDDTFATALDLDIGKSDANNTGNKALLDLNGRNLTLSRITNQHAAGYDNTANEGQQYIRTPAGLPATLTLNDTAADSIYTSRGSIMSGPITLIKAGTRTLSLGFTNALSGAFIVSNGTVNVTATGRLGPACTNLVVAGGTLSLQNSNAITPDASLTFPLGSTGRVNLTNGVNVTVATLWFGGTQKRSGTWGSTASPAQRTDDTRFTGTGILTVIHDKGGTVLLLR